VSWLDWVACGVAVLLISMKRKGAYEIMVRCSCSCSCLAFCFSGVGQAVDVLTSLIAVPTYLGRELMGALD
jgi:Na+/phosphate symporter